MLAATTPHVMEDLTLHKTISQRRGAISASPVFSHPWQDHQPHAHQRRSPSKDLSSGLISPKSKDAQSKKKIIGLLTLKEPSMTAWEEFAEAERRKKMQKGGQKGAKGSPESSKGKNREPKAADRSKRHSTSPTVPTLPVQSNWAAPPSTLKRSQTTGAQVQAASSRLLQVQTQSSLATKRMRQMSFEARRNSLRASSILLPPALAMEFSVQPDAIGGIEDYTARMRFGSGSSAQMRNMPPNLKSSPAFDELQMLDMAFPDETDASSSHYSNSAPPSPLPLNLSGPSHDRNRSGQLPPAQSSATPWAREILGGDAYREIPDRKMRPATINFSRPRPRASTMNL